MVAVVVATQADAFVSQALPPVQIQVAALLSQFPPAFVQLACSGLAVVVVESLFAAIATWPEATHSPYKSFA